MPGAATGSLQVGLCQLSAAEKSWRLFLASDAEAFFMSLKMSRPKKKRKGKAPGQEETPLITVGPGKGQVGSTRTRSHFVTSLWEALWRAGLTHAHAHARIHTRMSCLQAFHRLPRNHSFDCNCHSHTHHPSSLHQKRNSGDTMSKEVATGLKWSHKMANSLFSLPGLKFLQRNDHLLR